ncbi:hypothetical protein [Massilia polaris]|nr:hypothetical protein [Massilia polaris]
MLKQESSNQRISGVALAAVIALASVLGGCREKPAPAPAAPAPAAAATDAAASRTREQAMSALMALPELQAWSIQLEKASGGKVRGALIEYDSAPRVINGKSYWQFSFVENGSDAAHPWDSFLVAQQGSEILVEDFGTDTPLTLEKWRKEKRPMARTSGEMIGE